MSEWQTLETVPIGVRVLLWWTPKTPNRPAEVAITGTVSSYELGKFWDGQRGEYQDLARITHWMPLPDPPEGG